MRKLLGLLVLASCAVTPLAAQPTQAAFDSLKAQIAALQVVIGPYDRVIPCSEMEANRPTTELPNGEYNVMYRQKQLGCGINAVADQAVATRQIVDRQQTKLPPSNRTTQEYVASALSAIVLPPAGGIGNVVNGDLTVNGRICLPTCRVEVPAQIQIRAQLDAEISFESNMSGVNDQGPETHGSMLSASSDGGIRIIHNNLHIRNAAGNWQPLWVEPAKPRTIWAFDSQGTWSLSQDVNGIIDQSQSFIFSIDRAQKRIFLDSMKPGWTWGFRTSTQINRFDLRWNVPQQ